MKIAIQAADLDNRRIDGTRVYLLNVLKNFGKLSPDDEFFIYHRKEFNPQLTPPNFGNYKIKMLGEARLWTQTKFALNIWRDKPDVLWMPMHNIPLARRKNLKTVATIHDLAFKNFPETFPQKDLSQLNLLTDWAVKKSDKIIAVSESTKRDILKFYPEIKEEKIKVIYHGFDSELFENSYPQELKNSVLEKYNLKEKNYLLYVGAIQPRKNLIVLIKAFEIFKKKNPSDLKLVLAGGKAWQWEETIEAAEKSFYKDDIILTGSVPFAELPILYNCAGIFIFPSLYEGFGIPILEVMASGAPVIVADNSSLSEVSGEAAQYFDADKPEELAEKISQVWNDKSLQEEMIAKGKKQLQKFSWEKCARETLEFFKN